MQLREDSTLGELAATHPATVRVFRRHGIDFCCGGDLSLREASAAHGVPLELLLKELAEAMADPDAREDDWSRASLAALMDHIVESYHLPLRQELPNLRALAAKVLEAHGTRQPELLPRLRNTLERLAAHLEDHMMKEEQVLFPLIRRLEASAREAGAGDVHTGEARAGEDRAGDAGAGEAGAGRGQSPWLAEPIRVMEAEHDDAGKDLDRLRRLTDGYAPPPHACSTFRALYRGLADLEASMHRHVHLENNLLFPRAMRLARGTNVPGDDRAG